jgi:hypothetical protein
MLTPSSVCAYWMRGSIAHVFYNTQSPGGRTIGESCGVAATTSEVGPWELVVTTAGWRAGDLYAA